jgi:hypothetical protein
VNEANECVGVGKARDGEKDEDPQVRKEIMKTCLCHLYLNPESTWFNQTEDG